MADDGTQPVSVRERLSRLEAAAGEAGDEGRRREGSRGSARPPEVSLSIGSVRSRAAEIDAAEQPRQAPPDPDRLRQRGAGKTAVSDAGDDRVQRLGSDLSAVAQLAANPLSPCSPASPCSPPTAEVPPALAATLAAELSPTGRSSPRQAEPTVDDEAGQTDDAAPLRRQPEQQQQPEPPPPKCAPCCVLS
eukprot:TRINITY_DN6215_c0_g1_i1.p1 TRINITY_DN6215_c0_g1~~TRINITY_DN6215_c0_g1_i1.p1  ORF type:complete len:219 (+),score=98.86 TRINITY_DN6215_c0_g1_i1:87-659(+)